jgi:hypothetical protein
MTTNTDIKTLRREIALDAYNQGANHEEAKAIFKANPEFDNLTASDKRSVSTMITNLFKKRPKVQSQYSEVTTPVGFLKFGKDPETGKQRKYRLGDVMIRKAASWKSSTEIDKGYINITIGHLKLVVAAQPGRPGDVNVRVVEAD